jgi:hypothetical protein
VGVLGLEPGLGDDLAHQLTRALGMNPPGLPFPEKRGHLGGANVLVRVLWVVRGEELGQLVPHVIDELGESAQPGEDDQVTGVDPLPEVGRRHVWIGEKGWHIIPRALISGQLVND